MGHKGIYYTVSRSASHVKRKRKLQIRLTNPRERGIVGRLMRDESGKVGSMLDYMRDDWDRFVREILAEIDDILKERE